MMPREQTAKILDPFAFAADIPSVGENLQQCRRMTSISEKHVKKKTHTELRSHCPILHRGIATCQPI